jgi:hypothetical protein
MPRACCFHFPEVASSDFDQCILLFTPISNFYTQMLKTKSSRADFFRKDQKRVLILNGLLPPRHLFQF